MNGFKPIRRTFFFALALSLFLTACDSTEPDEGAGEEELITRAVLTLVDSQSNPMMVTATDPDGDGTNFQIDTINLTAGETYSGSIGFFDDINGEAITPEIEEEDDEHQLFYTPGGGAVGRVVVTVNDQDGNGLPVGLDFTVAVSAGAAASGTLNVVLSHYDDEPKNGTDRSDETDIDVTFPVNIQ